MTIRRCCNIEATKMKIEHIPNMIVIGNVSTYTTTSFLIVKKNKKIYVKKKKKTELILTLYKTMQTKRLSGTRKKFIMVLLASSGIYCDLIFIIDAENIPIQASKTQKPSSWMEQVNDKPSSFTFDGVTKT